MKRTTLVMAACAALAIAGCAPLNAPITGPGSSGTAPLPIPISSSTLASLKGVESNLDQAISIGVLPATDPADKCVHDTLTAAGAETPAGVTPGKSFTPSTGTPLEDGSVLYIRAQMAKAALGAAISSGLSVDCKALIGGFVIDGLATPVGVVSEIKALVR